MKRVLFIVTSLEVGGIETYLLRFSEYAGSRLDITVLCKSGNLGVLRKKYEQAGVNVVPLKLGWVSAGDYLNLYRYLKLGGFDTICDFTGDFAGPILLVAKMAGIGTRIAFYRGTEYQFHKTVLKRIYARTSRYLTAEYATVILSNSYQALDNFHPGWRDRREKYSVLRNGVPFFERLSPEEIRLKRSDLGFPENAFVVGHTGRFCSAKNHQAILELALQLADKYENVFFFLCGNSVQANIKKLVENTALESRVVADDTRDDIGEVLQCLDAFYFPSLSEGMPNSLIESMSLGLPFVASDIDSIREILPESYHEYLVAPSDTTRAMEILERFESDRDCFPSEKLSRWTLREYNSSTQFSYFYQALNGLE